MNNPQSSSWVSKSMMSWKRGILALLWCWPWMMLEGRNYIIYYIHTRDSCIKKATYCKEAPEPVQVITEGHVTIRHLYKTVSPVEWWSTSSEHVEYKCNMRNSFLLLFCPPETRSSLPLHCSCKGIFWVWLGLVYPSVMPSRWMKLTKFWALEISLGACMHLPT